MERTTTIIRFSANWPTKLVISLACLLGCFFHIGFYEGCPWWCRLDYSFCHANWFHLGVNLLVLWSIRNRIAVVESLAVAIVASFLPMYVSETTMGLSGFLFAAFGWMWGKTGMWKEAFRRVLPVIGCTMVMPRVNGLLHLYCFALGFFISFCIYKMAKATAHHE